MTGIDRKSQTRLGFSPDRLANIDAWMAAHVESGRLAGLAVQIARKGEIAYSRRHGLRERLWMSYPTASTIFVG